MILHILFKDGSNPYVCIPRKGDTVQKKKALISEFNRWKKAGFFPREIFSVCVDRLTIEHDYDGTWYIRYNNRSKQYKHLGHAINKAISLQTKGII